MNCCAGLEGYANYMCIPTEVGTAKAWALIPTGNTNETELILQDIEDNTNQKTESIDKQFIMGEILAIRAMNAAMNYNNSANYTSLHKKQYSLLSVK